MRLHRVQYFGDMRVDFDDDDDDDEWWADEALLKQRDFSDG